MDEIRKIIHSRCGTLSGPPGAMRGREVEVVRLLALGILARSGIARLHCKGS
jgi:hypothetical protein